MATTEATKLTAKAEKLIDLAGDSQNYSRSKAAKYFDRIVITLEEAQTVPGAINQQQRIALARLAGSLQAEFQF